MSPGHTRAEWPNWSAFVEYNYMDFGTSSGTTTNGVNVNLKRDMQNVLVGVSWQFGSLAVWQSGSLF